MAPSTEIIKSLSIEGLLAKRNAILERFDTAAQQLEEANELIASALGDESYAPLLVDRRSNTTFPRNVDRIKKSLDAGMWDYLMDQSGMLTLMDQRAKEKWRAQIRELDTPELTLENIETTFAVLHDQRAALFERGVVSLFRSLSWDYKTNNPRKLGKKIIIRNVISVYNYAGKRSFGGPEHGACDGLDDLCRVMYVLDGKPEPDHREGAYARLWEIYRSEDRSIFDLNEVNEMIAVRCFKNGNAHIYLSRGDLVEKMNEIIAKHHPTALPPKS